MKMTPVPPRPGTIAVTRPITLLERQIKFSLVALAACVFAFVLCLISVFDPSWWDFLGLMLNGTLAPYHWHNITKARGRLCNAYDHIERHRLIQVWAEDTGDWSDDTYFKTLFLPGVSNDHSECDPESAVSLSLPDFSPLLLLDHTQKEVIAELEKSMKREQAALAAPKEDVRVTFAKTEAGEKVKAGGVTHGENVRYAYKDVSGKMKYWNACGCPQCYEQEINKFCPKAETSSKTYWTGHL